MNSKDLIVWLIPFFPLLGAILWGVFGKYFKNYSGYLGSVFIVISFILSTVIFFMVAYGHSFTSTLYPWIDASYFKINISTTIDRLSVIMLVMVTGISSLVHIYSIGYMKDDKGFARYFSYLNLFVFSMIMLIMANNFLLLYVFWEAVGFCSYILIGFWYEKKSASNAGKKAFIVNRIGDFGFALGVMLIFVNMGTLSYSSVFSGIHLLPPYLITTIALLLFAGAIGKSAQFPLHVWLPDAMEGPTPVSALIHAATMVTAGVYLIARCHIIFSYSPDASDVVLIIGGTTAFIAAFIAMTQFDIKRIIAYSTISQLGYMFMAVGIGSYAAGIFHLVSHAIFKGLLFLTAGSVMHGMSGELDLRKMGGLYSKMKKTAITFIVGGLALSGIPPFSGFFSKDAILAALFNKGDYFFWIIGELAAFMTAFYIFRLIFNVFFGESHVDKNLHVHESPNVMTIPLIILACFAAVFGFIGMPPFDHSIFYNFINRDFANSFNFSPAVNNYPWYLLSTVSVIAGLSGIYVAYVFYIKKSFDLEMLKKRFKTVYALSFNKLYIDEIYDFAIVRPMKNFSVFLWRVVDSFVIDGAVNGIAQWISVTSSKVRKVQNGMLMSYVFTLTVGVIALLAYYFVR
ncbi:MAG: NADH-quinone oxidoreductase subunit L [Candidatus Acididesulfobacter guangdongensis]|uniref:NADH-quinone oxidoreductase subunit L n=1 Tax=Acididesulfobacter guangdongensis TaxID=2597225 RepID=A0A519BI16_ACIG2|nr:MAG: NADH-quinone oxidoreductase subunit L [Candidatus Acididesulfobacter guangdongensis]